MFKIVYPNRWFIWTIAILVVIAMLLWWAIEIYSIEQEYSVTPEDITYTIRIHRKIGNNPALKAVPFEEKRVTPKY